MLEADNPRMRFCAMEKAFVVRNRFVIAAQNFKYRLFPEMLSSGKIEKLMHKRMYESIFFYVMLEKN